ncbi:MAG: hypothetical protein ABH883_01185, partial [Candidatus Omnitrophota bacterium]
MEISLSFHTIAATIIKLFILMSIGYALYFRRIINDEFTDTLSLLLVRLFFPALIIYKTVNYFSFTEYEYWWFLPVAGIVFS